MPVETQVRVRPARREDTEELQRLIAASARALQVGDYSAGQIDAAVGGVFGVDTTLIDDGTYFAAEIPANETQQAKIVGCGGWSRRKTLFGGDQWHGHDELFLDPVREAAKIRAFFVHPAWARRGIGTLILDTCELAAVAAGFRWLEMAATLTGVKFYAARGYEQRERFDVQLGNGCCIEVVRMEKCVV
jgi:GNAT superfamily N-acetyltransferase